MSRNFGEGPSGYGCGGWLEESAGINEIHQTFQSPTPINQVDFYATQHILIPCPTPINQVDPYENLAPITNLPNPINQANPNENLPPVINLSDDEVSYANNNFMISYPWEDKYRQEELVVTPPHVSPPPQEKVSRPAKEGQKTAVVQTWEYMDELLDRITESNHQCYVAQKEVLQQRTWNMVLDQRLNEQRARLEEANRLLNQKQTEILRLQAEIEYYAEDRIKTQQKGRKSEK